MGNRGRLGYLLCGVFMVLLENSHVEGAVPCQDYAVNPICANDTRTFANRCYMETYYTSQGNFQVIPSRSGPCFYPGHPKYYSQFYDETAGSTAQNHYGSVVNVNPGPSSTASPAVGTTNATPDLTNSTSFPSNVTESPTDIPSTLPPCSDMDYYANVYSSNDFYNNTTPPLNLTTLDAANATCGDILPVAPNVSYVIQSPSFLLGSNYPPSFSCQYEFLGTEGCVPIVNCPFFSLVRSRNCTTDFFEVFDPVGGSDRFCGRDGPSFVSTGVEDLFIRFQTGLRTDRGYSCIVRCAEATDPVVNITEPEPATVDCQCGVLGTGQANKIVGGSNTRPNFYKWIVALFRDNETFPFCAGTLINSQFVLSAAHCFSPDLVADPSSIRAVFNEFDYSLADETATITRNITTIIQHPLFNSSSLDYDVALLEVPALDLLATREPKVTPICLPNRGLQTQFTGVVGTVIGWGNTIEGDNTSRSAILQQADVPIIANSDCNPGSLNVTAATPRMLCAGFTQGGIDACQGDGGGPLSVNDNLNEKVVQIGIVSFGNGCARPNFPGVYTRVTDVNDWIRDTAGTRGNGAVWCRDVAS